MFFWDSLAFSVIQQMLATEHLEVLSLPTVEAQFAEFRALIC